MASATARVNSLAACQCLMKVALKSLSAASAGTESRTAHTNLSLVMSNTSGLSLYPVQVPKQQSAYAPSVNWAVRGHLAGYRLSAESVTHWFRSVGYRKLAQAS